MSLRPKSCPACKTPWRKDGCADSWHDDVPPVFAPPIETITEKVDRRLAVVPTEIGKQVGGDHYQSTEIQALHVIHDWSLGFELGSVVKYIQRLGRKGDQVENIDKAIHYLQIFRARLLATRD